MKTDPSEEIPSQLDAGISKATSQRVCSLQFKSSTPPSQPLPTQHLSSASQFNSTSTGSTATNMSRNPLSGGGYPGMSSGFRPINSLPPQQERFQTLAQEDKFQLPSLLQPSTPFRMTPFENDTVQMSSLQMNPPKLLSTHQTPYQQISYQPRPFQLTPILNPTLQRPAFRQLPVQQAPVQKAQFQETPLHEIPIEGHNFQFADLDPASIWRPDVQQTPVQESVGQKTRARESLAQQEPVQESSVQQTPIQGTPVQESLAQQSPIQQSPINKSLMRGTPTQNIAAEEISTPHATNKEPSAQEAVSQKVPNEENPDQEVPTQGTSSSGIPSQDKPLRKRPGPKPKTWKPTFWQPYGPQPRDRYGYPDKSPLKQGTAKPCDHWYRSAISNPIFVKEVPDPEKDPELFKLVHDEKMLHLQTYFWPALDKANRKSARALGRPTSSGTWGYHDILGMLVWYRLIFQVRFAIDDPEVQADSMWIHMVRTSPWWDCPELQDMLYEEMVDGNGQVRRNVSGEPIKRRRDGRGREREFLEFWGPNIARLPLRRFSDGTMVMATNYDRFRGMYGAWAALWPHQRDPWFFNM